MIVLEIEMGLELGELFASVVKGIEAKLNGQMPREVDLPEDPEMLEVWSEELQTQLMEDMDSLDRFFSHPDFGAGEIAMEESEAEQMIRALSASRLGIRRLDLGGIPDSDLEGSMLPLDQMSEEIRHSYLCYLFLGGLQETIVQAMDPEASKLPEDFLELFSEEDESESSDEVEET